jgi:hypothetical protein
MRIAPAAERERLRIRSAHCVTVFNTRQITRPDVF